MRPVKKGNQSSYDPNKSPTATQRIIDLQSYIDLIPQPAGTGKDFAAVLEEEIKANSAKFYEKTNQVYVPRHDFVLPPDLIAEIGRLRAAFTVQASQPMNTPPAVATFLMTVQQLEFALRQALIAHGNISWDTIDRTFGKARNDLITNLGQFCSYCEMPLATSLAVEHKLPKYWFPYRALNWENFLLACPICNSNKSKNPSVVEAITTALAGPLVPPLSKEQIAASALSLYRWPDDELNYTAFESAFQYKMYKVLYNFSGNVYREKLFSPLELDQMVRRHFIQKLDQRGGHIRAETLTFLFDIKPLPEDAALRTYLSTVGPGQEVRVDDRNYDSRLDELRNKFNSSLPQNSSISVDIQIDEDVRIKGLGPNQWSLTQTSVYYIDIGDTINLYLDSKRSLPFTPPGGWTETPAAMRSALAGDSLPVAIAKWINRDPFGVTLTITPQDSRRLNKLEVTRNYQLTYSSGVLDVYAHKIFSVELRLAPTTPFSATPRSNLNIKKCSRVIEDVGLNKHTPQDQKQSDRRVARRTNAWFTAIACYENLFQAGLITDNPGVVTSLLEMIPQTAKFTGFWSVWNWIARSYLRGQQQVIVLAALKNPAYFPGTR